MQAILQVIKQRGQDLTAAHRIDGDLRVASTGRVEHKAAVLNSQLSVVSYRRALEELKSRASQQLSAGSKWCKRAEEYCRQRSAERVSITVCACVMILVQTQGQSKLCAILQDHINEMRAQACHLEDQWQELKAQSVELEQQQTQLQQAAHVVDQGHQNSLGMLMARQQRPKSQQVQLLVGCYV